LGADDLDIVEELVLRHAISDCGVSPSAPARRTVTIRPELRWAEQR
jgi:hypothetical protein